MRLNKITLVFIVEDDKLLQELYGEVFKICGFNVAGMANNGREAVKMFKSFCVKPDVVIMDHRMPIKNGIETTKEILQLDGSAIVIFVSADISIKESAISIGARFFIKKPFSYKKLINVINDLTQTN